MEAFKTGMETDCFAFFLDKKWKQSDVVRSVLTTRPKIKLSFGVFHSSAFLCLRRVKEQ